MQEGVKGIPSVDWRDALTRKFTGPFLLFFVLGTYVAAKTLHGTWERPTLVALAASGVLVVGLSAITGRPSGRARAWLLVIPGSISALIGYVAVGFLSGPAVILTLTLVACGLLLGKRAMWWLSAATAGTLGLIAWGMVNGYLQLPNAHDTSVQNSIAWARTLSVTYLGIGLFGTLIVAVIAEMEASLRQTQAEAERREQAEQQRAEAERVAQEAKQLESIGRLAAGVAHDFNNTLTTILGSSGLLLQQLAPGSTAFALANDIEEASLRAAELTRQLLTYSRKAQMVLAPLDVHKLLINTTALVQRTIEPTVRVETSLMAQEAIVAGDPTLLQSAFLNLIINAHDAMPQGGTIRVATERLLIREGQAAVDAVGNALPPGKYLKVLVADSGNGIAKDLLPRIFEPFFTTKPLGKGTGLGLSSVFGTIAAHHGAITVESNVGRGTVFEVLLPVADSAAEPAPALPSHVALGRGHILVVDDDAAVRNTVVITLTELGYQVTVAENGEAAIALLANSHHFDLVLLDLRMPGRSGESSFDEIRTRHPALKVLIWSGHGADNDIERMLRDGAAGFVQKPYRVAELSQVIGRLLHNSQLAN